MCHLSLDFCSDSPLDQTYCQPLSRLPSPYYADHLAHSLKELCQRLTSVPLAYIMFEPGQFFKEGVKWPHLRRLELHLTNILPSGEWYCDFPREVDVELLSDETYELMVKELKEQVPEADHPHTMNARWRSGRVKAGKNFSSLYSQAALAVQYMPKLESMSIVLIDAYDHPDTGVCLTMLSNILSQKLAARRVLHSGSLHRNILCLPINHSGLAFCHATMG